MNLDELEKELETAGERVWRGKMFRYDVNPSCKYWTIFIYSNPGMEALQVMENHGCHLRIYRKLEWNPSLGRYATIIAGEVHPNYYEDYEWASMVDED